MADPKDTAAAATAASPAGGGNNKMVMGLLGLNTVVMIAVAAVLFLGQKKQAQVQTLEQVTHGAAQGGEHGAPAGGEHGGGAAEAVHQSDVRFFSVGDFTANLSGPASTHYVKVNINFEINKDADEEEFKQRKPQFRDKILSLLNSKKPADLQSSEGRSSLKEEIKTVVNGFVQKGKVEGVYFSQFIIN